MIRAVQQEVFINEIETLEKPGKLHQSSSIIRLSPFLDKDHMLRVGGRLQNSFLSEDERHRLNLPAKDHVTKLLISQLHLTLNHEGPTLVLRHQLRRY